MIEEIINICKRLEENNIEYFLTGGCSLFVRGIVDTTKDIDLSIKESDLDKIKSLFKEKNIETTEHAIVFYENNYEVELLITNKEKDVIAHKILDEKKYDFIKIKNINLKLIPLKELQEMYEMVYKRDGKEKHLKRINFLKNLI